MIRSLITTLGELAGLACVVVGLWWLAPWMGMVALGLGLMFFSMLADRVTEADEPEPVVDLPVFSSEEPQE